MQIVVVVMMVEIPILRLSHLNYPEIWKVGKVLCTLLLNLKDINLIEIEAIVFKTDQGMKMSGAAFCVTPLHLTVILNLVGKSQKQNLVKTFVILKRVVAVAAAHAAEPQPQKAHVTRGSLAHRHGRHIALRLSRTCHSLHVLPHGISLLPL